MLKSGILGLVNARITQIKKTSSVCKGAVLSNHSACVKLLFQLAQKNESCSF